MPKGVQAATESGPARASRPRGARPVPLVALAAVAVALLSLLPFAYLFLSGISWHSIGELFTYPTTVGEIVRTVGLTVSISVVCVVLGVVAALVVVRTDVWLRRMLTVLLALPLAIPGFVSAYAVYSAGLMVAPRSNAVTSFTGATVIIALTLYPYVFLACVVAVRQVDPAQEEVARSLGARPVAVFWRVTLPQLRPAIAGSVLIVALHVLSEYGAMVQLGQHTLTTQIMSQMLDFGDYESARSLSLLLAGLALLTLLSTRLVSGRAHELSVSTQTVRPPVARRLGRARGLVLAVMLLVPLAAVGPTVFMTARGILTPHRSSGAQWQDLWAGVAQAAGATFGYALAAAVVATVLALPVAWWVDRKPSPLSQLTERAVWLAHAIPAAILALALVFLATRLVPGLYKTAALLVIAYVILFLPLAVANQRVGLQSAFVRFDEAAASLGRSPLQRLMHVSLPLALPGIGIGAMLVGLDASKELTTTLMLLPFNTQTLATGLWATTNGESLDFVAAAPYALVLMVLGSIPVWLISRRTMKFVR